ncbi:D-sedoheptulose 7-phosphate isomerase [Rhodospirillales bacterium URHD0017]|nr:D-sedoheptulose 7-phosphate isomerase [Rhodospirillales bacterium URHD0017]
MNEFADYSRRLQATLASADWSGVGKLADELLDCWQTGRRVFMCGNGGSAGNTIHLANDFLYGISKKPGSGLRVTALPANPAVVMALANDEGYEHVFSMQLAVLAEPGDVLIVCSGSGNSPNILRALECAREMGLRSYAVLGYGGGKAKQLADVPIHFAVDDMQISEDMQMIVGHMLMQWLYNRRDQADTTTRLTKSA